MIPKIGGALMAAMLLAATGCSIRMQAPIQKVAYDFSDHDFYDRAYAPSPAYASVQVPARGRVEPAPAEPQVVEDDSEDGND